LIPDRFRARLGDIALTSMARFFVPEIHLVVDSQGNLDGDRLGRAMRLLLDAEPILGCRYVSRWFRPYWQRLGPDELDEAARIDEEEAIGPAREEATQRFFGEPIPGDQGARVRCLWLRGGEGDRLVLKLHHQVADAAGTKQMAYRLARIYTRLGAEPDIAPLPHMGSRSQRQVYGQFGFLALLGMLRRYAVDAWQSRVPRRSLRLPMGEQADGPPRFQALCVGGPRLRRLRENFGGATLNDLMVTAFVRGAAGIANWQGPGTVRLVGTVDLRRYLPEGQADALCNLSSFMFPRFGRDLGPTFEDTLLKVKACIDRLKADHFGLGFNLGSGLVASLLPAGVVSALLTAILRSDRRAGTMPPVLTNMGPIHPERLAMGSVALDHAYLVVPAAFPDLFALGVSGCGDRITITGCHFDPALTGDQLAAILGAMDDELPD